ncbi:hypothetical protein Syun_012955 [Stephania yunnanensis]|uniref:RanBD1 domain-containing protein n=1 Tax=Stephania yunnanensis TaxID=152371 RepID=A0AAP0K1F6_9MAGN
MKGTKRLAQSEPYSEPNDATLRSKGVVAATAAAAFDFNRAEPSRMAERPSLDVGRAESSRQQVRALNTQFASWVQSQLQNHPDELWEDGVQDYLTHASSILEKFRDVVEWLKANAEKPGSVSTVAGSQNTDNKLLHGTKNNEVKFQLPERSGFTQMGSTPSFANSWSSGLLSKSPSSVLFGNQSLAPSVPEASDEPDGDELEQPSSPSVKKAEEKGITVVHEVKCKLYIKSTDPADSGWKDKGMGQLSIKCKEGVSKATKDSKPTIIVRNDVGKILLNALIYPGIKTNLLKNAVAAIFHTSGDSNGIDASDIVVARTYLIRTKTEEERNKLASAIQEYAPET